MLEIDWHHGHLMEFLFTPYLFVYLLFYYIAVSYLCAYLLDQKSYYSKNSAHQRKRQPLCCFKGGDACVSCCTVPFSLPLLKAETSFRTIVLRDHGVPLLLLIRALGLAFTVYYTVLSYLDDKFSMLYKFDTWCNLSAIFYFAFSLLYSLPASVYWLARVLHLFNKAYRGRKAAYSLANERFASFLLVSKVIALSNCLFITAIQLIFYDLYGGYANNKLFIGPSIALLLDLCASMLPHGLEHYFYSLSLPYAYLLFQWLMVFTKQTPWQYAYLHVDSTDCFRNYSILLLVHVGTYFTLHLVQRVLFLFTHTTPPALYHIPELAHTLEVNTSHFNMSTYAIAGLDDPRPDFLDLENGTVEGEREGEEKLTSEGEDDHMPDFADDHMPNMGAGEGGYEVLEENRL